MLRLSLTIFLFAAAAPLQAQTPARSSPTPGATAAPAGRVSVDTLEVTDLRKAISLLKDRYVNSAALSETELNRATLAGLLTRLGHGATLVSARDAAAPAAQPFYREILDGHIGYLRPGDLSRPQLQELDTTLRGFAGKKVEAIILDLRGCVESNDYATAAEMADRFVPKDKSLFKLLGPGGKELRVFVSNQAPAYAGLVVVLVDGATAGATEIVAGVLRHYDKAILVGQKTAGRPVDYADLALPSGNVLRLAVAEATLPDQRPRFPKGLEPDLPVELPAAQKGQIFQQSLTKGMAPFVFEADRPHLNEAALLAGTNPEIEAAQAAQQRRARGEDKAALHDAVLQRAVDLVTSIGVYEKQPPRSP